MRRLIIAVAMALLPVAGIAVAAQPASADPGGFCNSGRVCLYENTNYNRNEGSAEHWMNFLTSDSSFNNNEWLDENHVATGDGMNDETSSMRNDRGCTAALYQHADYSGARTSIAHGGAFSSLSSRDIGDNRGSSLRIFC
ncbi:peptidase inhibitor family I36 protein [Phytohabitans sp. LJ34]|uniref:peptidase inhibitor family I36 protein n=1 Tax=Phytohabitans sp. LJ34 TaxID=3452217 RepID=UPI003F88F331